MSIKPTKYVPIEYSILGIGAIILEDLHVNDTISSLWDRLNKNDKIRTFNRFAEGLTILYAANIIKLEDGVLSKINKEGKNLD